MISVVAGDSRMTDKPPISQHIEQAPWWVPCVLCFFAGAAIPLAVLMTDIQTPDYERGRADGYKAGRHDGLSEVSAEHQNLLRRIVALESEKFHGRPATTP